MINQNLCKIMNWNEITNPLFESLDVASFLILDITFFQGQFLLDNFIDKDKHYEFPIELMVSSSFLHYHLECLTRE